MQRRRVLVLIPARYDSSRFPGKPLAQIAGRSMIQRVFENCTSLGTTPSFEMNVKVVTDDQRIEDHVNGFGGNVVRVDDDVQSGSERIHLAYERGEDKSFDLIINVQGDEPLLKADELFKLAEYHLETGFDIATLVKHRTEADEFKNPNNVKAIMGANGKCSIFTRDANGKAKPDSWYHHIGVYSYRPEALSKFCSLPQSDNEKAERLEQLRALDNGMSIGAIETKLKLMGVDTPEDIEKVEGAIGEHAS